MPSIVEITKFIHDLSVSVPLPIFVFIGTILEEIIAPIPAQLIMITAGTIAFEQNMPLAYLIILATIGGVGKTISSFIFFWVSEKLGIKFVDKYGNYFGITKESMDKFSVYLNQVWKDNFILLVIRLIPIIPTIPVSVASGILKINRGTFLTSTFVGATIQNLAFLYLGFVGIKGSNALFEIISQYKFTTFFIILATVALCLWYYFWKTMKR